MRTVKVSITQVIGKPKADALAYAQRSISHNATRMIKRCRR